MNEDKPSVKKLKAIPGFISYERTQSGATYEHLVKFTFGKYAVAHLNEEEAAANLFERVMSVRKGTKK